VARRRDDGGVIMLDMYHQLRVADVVCHGLTGLAVSAVVLGEDE
jgi:hypothetical protein